MINWYVTIGVLGGQFAFQCTSEQWDRGSYELPQWVAHAMTDTRPAPPELEWWLGLPLHKWVKIEDRLVMRVNGGVMYSEVEDYGHKIEYGCTVPDRYPRFTETKYKQPVFSPIALTSGITVMQCV